ncbi:MAG: hypothetical protein MJB14_13270, partial [Spirochaetes bacterium]|nr:hypothetical protein [Spirochaetota bacterium]
KDMFIKSDAEGKININVDPLDMKVYRAVRPLPYTKEVPQPLITSPTTDFASGTFWVEVELEYTDFVKVKFYVDEGDGQWQHIGTDDNAPFRVRYNSSHLPVGSTVAFKTKVVNYCGKTSTTERQGIRIENRMPTVTVHYENKLQRDSFFGINSAGNFIFPQLATEQGYTFTWKENVDSYTLFYESINNDGTYDFDQPIYLELVRDIYPFSQEDNSGNLKAIVYINSEQEISDQPNFSGNLPETLPVDSTAANPLTRELYIKGGLNGWSNDNPLPYIGNFTFEGYAYLEADDIEYKFADSDWAEYNFGAPFTANGVTRGSNPANMVMNVPLGQNSLYKVNFFSYPVADSSERYAFFRLEKQTGPLAEDIYLHLNEIIPDYKTRLAYQGNGIYQAELELQAGEYSFLVADLTSTPGNVFGAIDSDHQWLTLDEEKTIALDSSIELKFTINLTANYRFILNYNDSNDPKLTILPLIDHGPYGAVYLRGGNAISPSGWDANAGNLFTYDENQNTLEFTVHATSTSTDYGDWQFKIADAGWAFQLTGTSNNWLDPANEVILNIPYTLGKGLQTLFIQPVPGIYHFVIDITDSENPVLTISKD